MVGILVIAFHDRHTQKRVLILKFHSFSWKKSGWWWQLWGRENSCLFPSHILDTKLWSVWEEVRDRCKFYFLLFFPSKFSLSFLHPLFVKVFQSAASNSFLLFNVPWMKYYRKIPLIKLIFGELGWKKGGFECSSLFQLPSQEKYKTFLQKISENISSDSRRISRFDDDGENRICLSSVTPPTLLTIMRIDQFFKLAKFKNDRKIPSTVTLSTISPFRKLKKMGKRVQH